MSEVSIRRALPADAHLLSFLAIRTFPLACPSGTSQANIDEFCEKNLSPDAFARYLSNPDYRVWVAMNESKAAGYVMSREGEPHDSDIATAVKGRPCTEISKIYVQQEFHGTTVASRLLSVVLEDAARREIFSAWLGVNQDNARANRFYERHGFVVVGTRKFLVGENWEDDFVRERTLAPGLTGNS